MWSTGILVTFAVFVKSELTTTTTPLDEETQETNSFSSPYMPSSAFKDIFTGDMPTIMMADDGSSSLDDNYVSTYGRYEKKNEKITTQPSTNQNNHINDTSPPSETTVNTTFNYERFYLTVSERPKVQRQRGVLDMLFPKDRVRTFKSVFDGLRRFLSHTFK